MIRKDYYYYLLIDVNVNNDQLNNTDDIPNQTDNEEIEQPIELVSSPIQHENNQQRQTIIPTIQNESIINHNHNETEEEG